MKQKANNPYRRPDALTKNAKALGYPARSIFKLEEIDRRTRLLKLGQHVLDLGAAPGSWSMYASKRIGPAGKLLAVDLQEIAGSVGSNAEVRRGDALSLSNQELALFAPYDVVLSDMAPSTTGDRFTDQARSFDLFMRAVDVSKALLKPGGAFVGKIFMGGDFEAARNALRLFMSDVRTMRPDGTRSASFEIFLIGLGRR